MVDDRYRIVGLLGKGGMGEVYRDMADDLKLGRPVALKFLPAGLERNASLLERFLGEVRTARQVTHANVCRVYDPSSCWRCTAPGRPRAEGSGGAAPGADADSAPATPWFCYASSRRRAPASGRFPRPPTPPTGGKPMNPCQRLSILASIVIVLLAASASAQVPYDSATLTSLCSGTTPQLTVQLDIVNTLPSEWTGWVVERTAIGACEPVATVYGPEAFPSGAQVYSFGDGSAGAGMAYMYRMRAVDAGGNRYYFGTAGTFSPGYYQTAFTTCGDAVAVRGSLTSGGMPYGIQVCEGQCWLPLSFVSELPAELEPLVDTTAVIELHGTLADEFEGSYLASVTSWTILGDCGVVPTTPGTWSGLKATYR